MKTLHLIATTVLAAALAACQHPKEDASRAQPGMQPGQGPQQEQAQGQAQAQGQTQGQATALGVPGAAAAQAEGRPDLQAGQQLASAGAPDKGVAACIGCHGAQGEGNAAGGFPRIAGQSQAYLAKQLGAYANDARVNPIMQPIAKGMNAQQIRDVSAYYASLGDAPAAVGSSGAAPGGVKAAGSAERGRVLSEIGDNGKEVQACANCHGPGGMGRQPVYPYLAGQHAGYLTAAMGAWKNGSRKTDPSGQMTHVAVQLTDADVAALSAYFSAQPAPPAATELVNIPAGSSEKPAVDAGPNAGGPRGPGGTTIRGAGTEQGAPTTGGAQGPGGGGGATANQPQNETPAPVRR